MLCYAMLRDAVLCYAALCYACYAKHHVRPCISALVLINKAAYKTPTTSKAELIPTLDLSRRQQLNQAQQNSRVGIRLNRTQHAHSSMTDELESPGDQSPLG